MTDPTSAAGVASQPVSPRFSYLTYVGARQVSGSLERTGTTRTVRAIAPVLAGVVILIGIAVIVSQAWPRYEQPLWVAVPVQLAGLPAVLVGVALWLQQRGNYAGPVLLIFGLVWYLGDLQAIDQEILFATGFSLYFLNLAVFTHLALLVPHGRLTTAAERATLTLLYVVLPGTQLLRYLEVRPLVDRQSFGDVGSYYSTWARIATYVGVPLTVFSVALVIRNFRRSTVIQRRAYGPFWIGASATGIAAVGAVLAEFLPGEAPQRVALVAYAVAAAGAAIGLLFGAVRLEAYSGTAFTGAWGHPQDLEQSVATALGDPGLKLYWRSNGTWLDSSASPQPVPPVPVGYARTIISVQDSSSALLIHDQVLAYQHALLRAVTTLTVNALERRRYDNERTLAFIDGQDAERRRIRQDLHDSAQGQLTGLRRKLRRLEDHLAPDDANGHAELTRMTDYVSELIEHLSTIVDNLYPEGVESSGLTTAMSRYVRKFGITVHLDIPYKRWPHLVERTAFFVISEALTNIVKHAQVDKASVAVRDTKELLIIEVTDEGVGIKDVRKTVLTSLRARVVALGGVLTIDSKADYGTRLHCSLPLQTMPNAGPTLTEATGGSHDRK